MRGRHPGHRSPDCAGFVEYASLLWKDSGHYRLPAKKFPLFITSVKPHWGTSHRCIIKIKSIRLRFSFSERYPYIRYNCHLSFLISKILKFAVNQSLQSDAFFSFLMSTVWVILANNSFPALHCNYIVVTL